MKEELEYSVVELENARSQLKSGCEKAKSELERDGVIRRF